MLDMLYLGVDRLEAPAEEMLGPQFTPWKIHIWNPKNRGVVSDHVPFQTGYFQVPAVNFPGCKIFCCCFVCFVLCKPSDIINK